jgi:hypothetical protein
MPIDIKTLESILSGEEKPDLKRTVLGFTIGTKTEMKHKDLATAVLAWRALKIEPSTAIMFHFGGYDDDPRELWDIPEVCTDVQKFCAKTQAHKHPQVEPQSHNWLSLCIDPALRVLMISQEEAIKQSLDFFKQVTKPETK